MSLMKCILVGRGYWGRILEKYLEGAGFDVEYIFTSKDQKSFEEILALSHAEAVFICSPVSTHYEYVRKALVCGKHVFCEKMLTGDLKQAEELFALADQAGKVLFTDYIYLYSPSIRKARELCDRTGPVREIRAEITQFGKFYQDTDVTGNIAVHMISALGYLTDFRKPDSIFREIVADAKFRRDKEAPSMKEAYDLPDGQILDEKIAYEIKGLRAVIRASIVADEKVRRIRTSGFRGDVIFDMMKDPALEAEFYNDNAKLTYSFDEMNNLKESLRTFSACIQNPTDAEYDLNRQCSLYVERFAETLRR